MFVPVAMKLDLQQELLEQLEIEEVFSFHIGSLEISVDETTVVSWIIMAVLAVAAFFLTRNLKVTGKLSKRQILLETAYEKSVDFFMGIVGKEGKGYIPWLMSMALFIGVSNIIGLFGFKPPTKSFSKTFFSNRIIVCNSDCILNFLFGS